jgi:hypothetical protein
MGRGGSDDNDLPRLRSPAALLEAQEMTYIGSLTCDVRRASKAWRTTPLSYRDDHAGNAGLSWRQMEKHVAHRVGGRLVDERLPFDVLSSDGRRLEVRGFTNKVTFSPSSSRGAGRSSNRERVEAKLNAVDAFVFYDATQFPTMPCWLLPSDVVRGWLNAGTLGKSGTMTRSRFDHCIRASESTASAMIEAHLAGRFPSQATSNVDEGWRIQLHIDPWEPNDTRPRPDGPASNRFGNSADALSGGESTAVGDAASLAAAGAVEADLGVKLATLIDAADKLQIGRLERHELNAWVKELKELTILRRKRTFVDRGRLKVRATLSEVGALILDALFVDGRVEPRAAALSDMQLVTVMIFTPDNQVYLNAAFERAPTELVGTYLAARAAGKKRLASEQASLFAFELTQATVLLASKEAQMAGWCEYAIELDPQ